MNVRLETYPVPHLLHVSTDRNTGDQVVKPLAILTIVNECYLPLRLCAEGSAYPVEVESIGFVGAAVNRAIRPLEESAVPAYALSRIVSGQFALRIG